MLTCNFSYKGVYINNLDKLFTQTNLIQMYQLLKRNENWCGVCIVGIGKHTNTKIIPALKIAQRRILGIVSTKKNTKYLPFESFYNLNDAINSLPKSTLPVKFAKVEAVNSVNDPVGAEIVCPDDSDTAFVKVTGP